MTEAQVGASLGLSDQSLIQRLLKAYDETDRKTVLDILRELEEQGADPAHNVLESAAWFTGGNDW